MSKCFKYRNFDSYNQAKLIRVFRSIKAYPFKTWCIYDLYDYQIIIIIVRTSNIILVLLEFGYTSFLNKNAEACRLVVPLWAILQLYDKFCLPLHRLDCQHLVSTTFLVSTTLSKTRKAFSPTPTRDYTVVQNHSSSADRVFLAAVQDPSSLLPGEQEVT